MYVRAFYDGNGDGHGDFKGLIQKLDYLQELGVDCLWLLPIYPSPLADDGYDVADFCGIHPDYGTLDDFKAMLDEAHKRGLRVITDLVLNHTSDQHPWFREARTSRDSPKRDYYVWSDTDQKYKEARIIFVDSQTSNWEFDPQTGQYYWHRFFPHQPDLNYDNPEVQQAMLDVMRFWLDLGVDGFRADAVPYLFEREGTSCENLPETHAYLKRLRAFIDANYPGRILLSEANQWPEDTRLYFGDGDEFHMAFHFPVMPRIFMSLARADRQPILDILARTPPIPESCQWCTFLRCHDELTLEMVTEEERAFLWDFYAPEPRMRLNLGIRRRLAPLLDNDRRKIELANSLLFTLPGSPIIYYGDEIGMGDNVWLEDRDGLRTPMQWSDDKNAGFSTAHPSCLYSPVIDDEVFSYRKVNVRAQRNDPSSLLHTMRKMVFSRKKHKSFGRGDCQFLHPESIAVLAYIRQYEDETILVVNNLSGSPQLVALELASFAGSSPRDILSGESLPPVADKPYILALDPYQYLWLRL
ncbi:MAG TPA: maltose alpha-D-glucosyltransferase [Anaerolineae bacterium]|nr:maltose alpha-D-glucosyltransferase [Anaerolineae bacterium]